MKQGGPSPRHISQEVVVEVPAPQVIAIAEPAAPAPSTSRVPPPQDDQDAMEVDEERAPRHDDRRDASRRPQQAYTERRPPSGPSGAYNDGRHGFRESYDRRDGGHYQQRDREPRNGLYSDGMYRGNRNYRP